MEARVALSGKPWETYSVPAQVRMPRGMIGSEERRMLYWLGAEYFSGAGTIVDAGAYLGASAFALASGVALSPHTASPHAVVHSYDRFVADDDYVRDDIARGFFPVLADYDYFEIFQFQTYQCRDWIVARRGDFLGAPPPDSPIEILFIDVAKNEALNNRFVEHYFPRLIPGRSAIVQQDYYQGWYPHIPIAMEYFADYLTMVDPFVADSSRLYLLTEAIPPAMTARFLSGLPVDEEAALLGRAIEKDRGLTRMMLRVVEVLHLVDRQGRPDQAREAAAALRQDAQFDPGAYYANQLESIVRFRQLL